jgi:hypothetical protein
MALKIRSIFKPETCLMKVVFSDHSAVSPLIVIVLNIVLIDLKQIFETVFHLRLSIDKT